MVWTTRGLVSTRGLIGLVSDDNRGHPRRSTKSRSTSTNGNTYRNSVGSIFQSEDGIQDSRGLEFGDSDTRQTWQGKTGIVLNPLGPGVYVRPSIRLLYGVQVSSQHAAWGSSFVDSQNQYDDFYSDEDLLNDRHIHQVVALEAEAWF